MGTDLYTIILKDRRLNFKFFNSFNPIRHSYSNKNKKIIFSKFYVAVIVKSPIKKLFFLFFDISVIAKSTNLMFSNNQGCYAICKPGNLAEMLGNFIKI